MLINFKAIVNLGVFTNVKFKTKVKEVPNL
jgi:hypothetical protein